MATRKKKMAKRRILKKQKPPTINQLAMLLRDEVLNELQLTQRRYVNLTSEVSAMREAIERLDVTIAKALAEAATKVEIDPSLYPGQQDGGVPTEVATKQYDKASDAELLA